VQKEARITSRGQVTVPRDICRALGVSPQVEILPLLLQLTKEKAETLTLQFERSRRKAWQNAKN